MYQNIILHIPHNSALIPDELGDHNAQALENMRADAFYMVDYHTLSLFQPSESHPNIQILYAPLFRMLVDMERMYNDPLEKDGFGIVSQLAINWLGEEFRPLALKLYDEYHDNATQMINSSSKPLLIDCHSFSAHPTPLCPCPPDVDICIGWNEDKTTPERLLLSVITGFFIDCGYKIALNSPFSNSKTFVGATGYHSVMIEINKRCYMDEETLKPSPNFQNLHNQLQRLYSIIFNYR